tara:strand:- start:6 stop:278 length:273 start_codon:yes stop_codon:yes gene_type:complete
MTKQIIGLADEVGAMLTSAVQLQMHHKTVNMQQEHLRQFDVYVTNLRAELVEGMNKAREQVAESITIEVLKPVDEHTHIKVYLKDVDADH